MTRPKGHTVAIIAIIAVVAAVYFLFNPSDYQWMPQCVFHKVTGLQCMGCGAQRMLHSLLHGDFRGAMQANMLLFFSLPFLAFLVFAELNRTRYPCLYKAIHTLPVIIAIAAILVVWLIIRNILSL